MGSSFVTIHLNATVFAIPYPTGQIPSIRVTFLTFGHNVATPLHVGHVVRKIESRLAAILGRVNMQTQMAVT